MTRDEAIVELIEEAMMSGFVQITANKHRIIGAYSGATELSGADLLKVALGDFPTEFAAIRSDLIDAIFEDEA